MQIGLTVGDGVTFNRLSYFKLTLNTKMRIIKIIMEVCRPIEQ